MIMKMNVYDIIRIKVASFRTGLALLMLFFAVSWAGSVQAQVPGAGQPAAAAAAAAAGGTVSGIVIDSVTNKPVDYATVSLFKAGATTPFSGGLSDEKGA